MAILRSHSYVHWNYFLALEEDLDRLSRYVDLAGGNDGTYSIEIARLLLGASSEVDVVLKQLCRKHNQESAAASIRAYFGEIYERCPNFIGFEVQIPRYGLTLHPWSDWVEGAPPIWWQDHNKVKHHRDEHFSKANLKNCVNSVAALFVAVLHLYEEPGRNGELLQLPRLFNVGDQHFRGTQMGRYGNSFKYEVR
ncbi:hypothetical protein [Cupriavidus gilardii]|uniref:hypothetical protein n=1 Tax=Cupriavidus gilardii TaxID=82541 RepID=UPI0021B1D544|nr:hypothetical protein [Cupriavidus gilardii]UXC38989.1 hypothetical protein N4G38_19145 [Cupriavidus gilardii]